MPRRRNNTSRKPNPAKVGRRRRARVKASGPNANLSALAPAVHAVCGITDPFCAAAYGAKVPDGATTKSIAVTYETLHEVLTDASGAGALLLTPEFWTPGIAASAMAGDVATFPLNACLPSDYDDDVGRWRMVSFGVEVQSVTSQMTSQGSVHLRTFSPDKYDSLSVVPTRTYYADSHKDVPVRDCREKVISKRLGTEALVFKGPAGISTQNLLGIDVPGYQAITVAVFGAQAETVVLLVRVVRHLEYVPIDGTITYQFATKAPKPNGAIVEQSNTVLNSVGNYLGERASEVVHSTAVKSVARSALAWGANAAASYFLGPAAGTVTGLLTNGAMAVD